MENLLHKEIVSDVSDDAWTLRCSCLRTDNPLIKLLSYFFYLLFDPRQNDIEHYKWRFKS